MEIEKLEILEKIDAKKLQQEIDEFLCKRLELCEEIARKMWFYSI